VPGEAMQSEAMQSEAMQSEAMQSEAMQSLCDRSHGFAIFSVRATRCRSNRALSAPEND